MALHSYKSLQSSWETEPFSRGVGSDFWASGSLQAAHCQNNTALSGHINHFLSHSPEQPSSFLDAAPRDVSGTVETLCDTCILLVFSLRRPPEPCGHWEGEESHPQLFRHQAVLSPLAQAVIGKDPISSQVNCTAGWRPGRSQQGRCFFFRSNLLTLFVVFCWKALLHAYLAQHFKRSLLEENMLLTWSKVYSTFWYVKIHQWISTIFSKIACF